MDEAEMDPSNLQENMVEFNTNARPKNWRWRIKRNSFDSINAPYEGRELILIAFKSGIFPIKPTKS